MKYAVISDIHANLEALETVLAAIEDVGVDQIVCLGDVVGYNANPNECVELIRKHQIPTVCGNHDAVAAGVEEPWDFNPIALAAALWTRQQLNRDNAEWLQGLQADLDFPHFLAAHGSPADHYTYLFMWEDVLPHLAQLESRGHDLCFFGHTHSPGIFSSDGTYSLDEDSRFALGRDKVFFINPGSVGQPRDGDPRAAFGVFDTESREYELVRVAYPVERAAERIIQAGLPHFLADRLSLGR